MFFIFFRHWEDILVYPLKGGSNLREKGSLTVEASFVFPVFIFAVLTFVYFIQVLQVQENIQAAITDTARYAAKCAYLYENMTDTNISQQTIEMSSEMERSEWIPQLIDTFFLKSKMHEYIDSSFINHSCVVGGMEGVHLLQSTFMKGSQDIDIIASYKIKFPVPLFIQKSFSFIQRVRLHAFTGKEEQLKAGEDSEGRGVHLGKAVYITENAEVYHLSKECTHLKLSIQETTISGIEGKRNNYGGKYKRCIQCSIDDEVGEVYYTCMGNCYHYSLQCGGLKRTVFEVPFTEAEGMPVCKRCKGE